jgi:hypothetical protein
MNTPILSRRGFLKTSMLAGLGASVAGIVDTTMGRAVEPGSSANEGTTPSDPGRLPPRPAGQHPVHELTTKPLERVRVAVIGLHRGMAHVQSCLGIDFADITAVCDLRDDRAKAAADACEKKSGKRPAVYGGTEDMWEKMVDRDDIDVVYVATPWAWHVPMSLRAMQRGKHAFVEVAAAMTVEDCWRLVNESERTQRHCVMLENCCYGENELFVLNMVRQGVFGDLTHAECGYIHDLRDVLFQLGSEGDWRRDYHRQLDGNLYPTHGLGPVAQSLGVGCGDQFKALVSMSSKEAGLTLYRDAKQPNGGRHATEKYVCGDVNTSVIKTELGRTILLQHSVVCPRPYSRINAVCGTGATFFDYPARMAINDPSPFGLEATGPHEWLGEKDLAKMRQMFTHPLWAKLADRAAGSGHGGMDYVIDWRHLDCVRRGVTPDSVVYDAAAWSCIIELSTRSVAAGGTPVAFPDFTRGLWRAMKPIGIAEAAPKSA